MNQLLDNDFKKYLEETKNPPKPISIDFFEWSNIDAVPISFKTISMFKDFLDKHNIIYTEKDIEFITTKGTCYASCPKNKATLLLTEYKYELRNALNGNPVTTPRPHDNPYYPTCQGYDHRYYDDYCGYNYYDYD